MRDGSADHRKFSTSIRLAVCCSIWEYKIHLRSGEVALSLNAGLGFPLRSPLAGAPLRNRYPSPNGVAAGSSIAVLSAAGSSLIWSSYLDNSVPAVAFAPDGSLYAAVVSGALDGKIGHGSVWRLPAEMTQDVSIDSVANAFSGFSDAIAPGSLVALTGTNLSSDVIDLGLNSPQDLPTELGGVRVYFDGVPAQILQIAPRRVICVAPLEIQDRAVLQLTSTAGMSNPIIMPVNRTAPGLLTRSFPDVAPFGRDVNGVVRNEDGSLNDADHPAARGSAVTLYATGLGLTPGSGDPGTTDKTTPTAPLYAWWSFSATSLPAPAATMPGFVSAILQVQAPVPVIGMNDGTVQRLTVALESFVRVDAHMNSVFLPSPADQVVVYVK